MLASTPETAEAAWDEDGATPALGALTPPVPRSERPPSAPPAPHPASPDVTSLRVKNDPAPEEPGGHPEDITVTDVGMALAPRCTCPCGCRWTVKAGGRCPQCARGSHRRPA